MIETYKEPEGMEPYENCIFCNKPTPYWHEATNNPICLVCAAAMEEEDILIANNRTVIIGKKKPIDKNNRPA